MSQIIELDKRYAESRAMAVVRSFPNTQRQPDEPFLDAYVRVHLLENRLTSVNAELARPPRDFENRYGILRPDDIKDARRIIITHEAKILLLEEIKHNLLKNGQGKFTLANAIGGQFNDPIKQMTLEALTDLLEDKYIDLSARAKPKGRLTFAA